MFALGERVIVLENGRVIAQGTPHQVMTAPRLETVAQLAGFENIFDATVVAAHEERGTMVCQLSGSKVEIETPLVRAEVGSALRVGIRAGDILLASLRTGWLERPQHYSRPGGFAGAARRDRGGEEWIAGSRWKSTSRWRRAIPSSCSPDEKCGWW